MTRARPPADGFVPNAAPEPEPGSRQTEMQRRAQSTIADIVGSPNYMDKLREQREVRNRNYSQRMAVYDRLRDALRTDKLNLDDELMQLPFNTQEAAEHCAVAINRRELCAHDGKIITALAAREFREDPTFKSESAINSALPLHPNVIEAARDLENCRAEANMWQALVNSWDSKRSAMRVMGNLISSGYISSGTITAERRQDMQSAARQHLRNEKG